MCYFKTKKKEMYWKKCRGSDVSSVLVQLQLLQPTKPCKKSSPCKSAGRGARLFEYLGFAHNSLVSTQYLLLLVCPTPNSCRRGKVNCAWGGGFAQTSCWVGLRWHGWMDGWITGVQLRARGAPCHAGWVLKDADRAQMNLTGCFPPPPEDGPLTVTVVFDVPLFLDYFLLLKKKHGRATDFPKPWNRVSSHDKPAPSPSSLKPALCPYTQDQARSRTKPCGYRVTRQNGYVWMREIYPLLHINVCIWSKTRWQVTRRVISLLGEKNHA